MILDNYSRAVLTVIALCLVYLCVRDLAPPAHAQNEPTRVIVTGVALEHGTTRDVLPVGIVGEMRVADGAFSVLPARAVQVRVEHPVEIRTVKPIRIEADRPLKIEADRPLPVRAIREPGSQRPGEQ